MGNNLGACIDVNSLTISLRKEHIPQEWRISIDSSKLSFKKVMLLM